MKSKFTLIELLVVVAIFSILMSILLPSLSNARESVLAKVCMNNLKQLSIVAVLYAEDSDEQFWFKDNGLSGPPYASWVNSSVTLSPYLQGHDKWSSNDVVWCPSDQYARTRSHKWHPSFGYNTQYLEGKQLSSVNSPQETLFLADSGHVEEDEYNAWLIKPNHIKQAIYGRRHNKGANTLWVDSHVTFNRLVKVSEMNGSSILWDRD